MEKNKKKTFQNVLEVKTLITLKWIEKPGMVNTQ
jgi:hypothetical protein